MKNKGLLFIPFLLSLLATLPSLFTGFDNETIKLWVYPQIIEGRQFNLDTMFSFSRDLVIFRPLHYYSFILDTALFGSNSVLYHLENTLLSLVVLYLLYKLGKLFRFSNPALFTSLLFVAINPSFIAMMPSIHVRNDMMVGLSMLLTVLLFKASCDASFRKIKYLAAIIVYFLSIFWKENLIFLPFLLIAADFLLHWSKGRLVFRLLLHAPFFVVAAFSVTIRFLILGNLGYAFLSSDYLAWLFSGNGLGLFIYYLQMLWSFALWRFAGLGVLFTAALLLLGPDMRSRIFIVIALFIAAPYVAISPAWHHFYVPVLALSLWSGSVLDDLIRHRRKLFMGVFVCISLFIAISWVLEFTIVIPKVYESSTRNDRIVHYIQRKHPNPHEGTVFVVQSLEVPAEDMFKEKMTESLTLLLRVQSRRDDLWIVPEEAINSNNSSYDKSREIFIKLPEYILR